MLAGEAIVQLGHRLQQDLQNDTTADDAVGKCLRW